MDTQQAKEMKSRLSVRRGLLSLMLAVLACGTSSLSISGSGAASGANHVDSDLVPPDVTLPEAGAAPVYSSASGSATAAAAGQSNAPGLAPGATAPQPYSKAAAASALAAAAAKAGEVQSSAASAGASSGPTPNPEDAKKPDPVAIIDTEKGRIVIRLFRSLAPKTVANFIDLCSKGFYNGVEFHRVEPGFCIQAGVVNGEQVYREPDTKQIRLLPLETNPQLKHNAAGVVAMARFPKNPNTSSCQFYITLAPKPNLDGQYSIFGGVIDGMNVVNQIAKGDKITTATVQEQAPQ